MTAEARHLRKMRKPKRYRTRPSKPLSVVGIEEAIQNLRNQASKEGNPATFLSGDWLAVDSGGSWHRCPPPTSDTAATES